MIPFESKITINRLNPPLVMSPKLGVVTTAGVNVPRNFKRSRGNTRG